MTTINKNLNFSTGMLNTKRGFSFVEVMLVLAIITIMIFIIAPSLRKMKENQILKTTLSEVISAINKAKSQSISSVNSSEYGIHFQSDKIVLFKGTTYSSGSASNENIILTTPATISSITFTGGATDLYFDRLSGAPNKTGTITVMVSSSSRIITISATGTVSMN